MTQACTRTRPARPRSIHRVTTLDHGRGVLYTEEAARARALLIHRVTTLKVGGYCTRTRCVLARVRLIVSQCSRYVLNEVTADLLTRPRSFRCVTARRQHRVKSTVHGRDSPAFDSLRHDFPRTRSACDAPTMLSSTLTRICS